MHAQARLRKAGERRRTLAGTVSAVAVCSLVALSAGGCTNCTGDPRFDGAGCSVQAAFSGTYEKKTEQLKKQADDSQARAAALRKENEGLNRKMAQLTAEERTVAKRLQQTNKQVADMIKKLEDLRRQNKITQDQYDLMDVQLRDIESRQKAASRSKIDGALRSEVEQLESEVKSLQRILETG
jgi:septal ring factor EnvC (AmiA/AmiB activator)